MSWQEPQHFSSEEEYYKKLRRSFRRNIFLGGIIMLLSVFLLLWHFSCFNTLWQFLRLGYQGCSADSELGISLTKNPDSQRPTQDINGYLEYFGQGLQDILKIDSDGDGIADITDTDDDGDGTLDTSDADDNNDGRADAVDGATTLISFINNNSTATPQTGSTTTPASIQNITYTTGDGFTVKDLRDVTARSQAITFLGNPENSVLSAFAIGIDESKLDIANLGGDLSDSQIHNINISELGGLLDLTSQVTGVLPVVNGGTGVSTVSSGSILIGNGTNPLSTLNPGTAGQILTMSGGVPTWQSPAGASVCDGTTSTACQNGNTLGEALILGTNDAFSVNFETSNTTRFTLSAAVNSSNQIAAVSGGDLTVNGITVGRGKDNISTSTAVGVQALAYTSGAQQNTAIGASTLQNATSAGYNTAVGAYALNSLNTGNDNTAIGRSAMQLGDGISNNVAIGGSALLRVTGSGSNNTGVGVGSGNRLTTGTDNTFIGQGSGVGNNTGNYNVFLGSNAGGGNGNVAANTSNVGIGYNALLRLNGVTGNTVIGNTAGDFISTGNNNTILGYNAGNGLSTGSNNILIGNNAEAASGTASNQLNIGNLIFGTGLSGTVGSPAGDIGIGTTVPIRRLHVANASGGTQTMTLSTNDFDSFGGVGTSLQFASGAATGNTYYKINAWQDGENTYGILALQYGGGTVGIGTVAPTAQLHTTGSVRFATFGAGTLQTDASGNLSVSSDERLKRIQGTFDRGLSALQNIQPIAYKWRANSNQETEGTYYGFSAQNIQKSIPEAVGEDSRGYLTLSDRPILAAVINATKELAGSVDTNKEDITALNSQVLGYSESTIDLTGRVSEITDRLTKLEDTAKNLNEEIDSLQEDIANNSASVGITTDGIFDNGITVSSVAVFNGIASFVDGAIFDTVVQFKDGAIFDGVVIFNRDAAGHTTIEAGKKKVNVTFDTAYSSTPVVTATPENFIKDGSYRVTNVSKEGFDIEIDQEQEKDVDFSWTALQTQ